MITATTSEEQSILDRVFRHLRKQAEVEAEGERATEHARLAGEVEAIRCEQAETVKRLAARAAKALAAYTEKRAAADAAFAVLRGIQGEQLNTAHQARIAVGRRESRLREIADGRIGEAQRSMEMRLAEMLGRGLVVQTDRDYDPAAASGYVLRERSNQPGQARIVRAVTAARRKFDLLRLVEGDVPAGIAEIEMSIPWSDVDRLE